MQYTETHQVTLVKPAKRQLRDQVIEGNITAILASVNNKSLAVRGWTIESASQTDTLLGQPWKRHLAGADESTEYVYDMYIRVNFARADGHQPRKDELPAILRSLATKASQPVFGKWTLNYVNGDKYVLTDTGDVVADDILGYQEVDMPDDWDDNFAHLFGLSAHISRVRSALMAGLNSGWRNRFHCELVGPPGCGKSDICRSIKQALGEDAVMEFDATATTAAGAIKELAEREILPRVIVIEEIEKADEKTMSFLLGVLDLRAEIRKTTARATIQRDTKLFAIATVNDVGLFHKLQAGALASRFTNEIHFTRPTRETLALILTREVERVNGNPKWIDPTLDYCDHHDITDPRKVIAICLCGADDLLTGEYQKMLEDTAPDE